MLALNAFLLKRAINPVEALTELDPEQIPQLVYRSNDKWYSLDWEEADAMRAAQDGDMFVLLVARKKTAPHWQEFLNQEVALLSFEGK